MIDIGVFHNGSSDLPIKKTGSGIHVADGDLAAVHESAQRTLISQVRQGILAERLGYDSFYMTEHHFQPEGAEFSPNPLLAQTAVAAQTKRIRLGQSANIITWWHPLRFAEQVAMLDVISGGRVEVGMGRGYQPRENETFGKPYGSTIQDQERNRAAFEEAYEIILRAWSEGSFSHHGENFSIPPAYTKWNHPMTIAYFEEAAGPDKSVDDVLQLGGPDMYSGGPPVQATTTRLKEISVQPQPLQKPHPQIWQPMTSPRSIQWAAQHGINGFYLAENNSRLKQNLEIYHEAASEAGFPDHLDRGEFKFGWDADKRRGQVPGRWIHIVQDGIGDMDRAANALRMQWDYYSAFGFAAILAEADEPFYPVDTKVTPELVREKEIAIHGSAEYVTEAILRIKETCGYDDFAINLWFESNGFSGQEIEEQMHCFAEEVMPALRSACGGGPNLPESTVDLDVSSGALA